MMGVLHNFECAAHGVFEARTVAGLIPRCPHGCSPGFVTLIYLQAPALGSERVRTATRLVREMADCQGLSDIDVSPSRPGDSVADRNFKRNGAGKEGIAARPASFSQYMGALTHRANELANAGFGHPYNPGEWLQDKKSGVRRHLASPPVEPLPMNQFGVSVARVREKP